MHPTPQRREIEARLSRGAMVGVPFSATLDPPMVLHGAQVAGLDHTGLAFDPATGAIAGLPTAAGLLELTMTGDLAGEAVAVHLRLPVSPDPWSLWKDLPVDPALPYQKPDMDTARIDADLLMLAASRRGRSHAHKGLPRDDDALIFHDPTTGWHIGAVADGAGSSALSREGARLAVTTVGAVLPGLLAEQMSGLEAAPDADHTPALEASLGVAARHAAEAIARTASDIGQDLRAFSTTLIIGAAKRLGARGWYCAGFSIGDGLIGVVTPDVGMPPRMMRPDGGAFAGQTRFLAPDLFTEGQSLAPRLQARIVPDLTAFLLMTDGVSDPMFQSDNETEDPAAWARLWADHLQPLELTAEATEPAQALLDWLAFRIKGEHDDRSLVAMIPGRAP